ncbi:hypothetical protein K501DRAFT_281367 [Backusella circina FSU 941]|nr:hypothetical protein K501DRAFT_281367 [Backusella circina FSU 941]
MATFEIKWGANRYSIDLSQEEYDKATVADLKLKCQSLTKVEPHFQKLLSHGAILKDEQKLIKEYKIQTGSKIMMMGSTVNYIYIFTY